MILKYIVFTAFLKIISISCDKQYGSLTFVIDTTGSMQPEIHLVNNAANEIMEIILLKESSQIKDVVLVTFNDPTYQPAGYDFSTKVVLSESRNINEVKTTLANLVIEGGADCEEYSLSGIEMGLSRSKRNSYLFVFTDAPPKDGHVRSYNGRWTLDMTELSKKEAGVKKLAQSRGSQVFFFLTKPFCHDTERYKVYWDIAAATNGQVFILEQKKDVALLIPFLEIVISGNADTINRVVIPANEWGTVPFAVDDQTEYVVVSASSSGNKVDLDITKSPTPTLNKIKISWTENNKILKIDNPAPGSYEAHVRGSSETTVMIIGRTDFTFQHGFSETVPPTFRNDKLQPTEGIKSSLLVKVMDPTHSVEIKTAQIVSADGKIVYYSLPLKKQSNNYYSTQAFLPPVSMFLITIIGEGKKTHKEIKRTAKTPIQSRPRDTDPEVSTEGGGKYTYKSNVLLTCKVKAFPAPVITWRDDKGNVLPSLSEQKKDTYNHISKINIQNLIHKSAYYCHAQVGVNENSDRVDLDVISPFKVDEDTSKASVIVEFEKPAELKCNIKSKFSMGIVWYHISGTNRKILNNSAEYKISSDETQMTVNKVKQENQGKYVCEARMRNDPTTTYRIETNIEIKQVAPIMGKADKVRINENNSVDIKCNIMKAYPKPKVIWMFRSIESDRFQPLHEQGEILKIEAASLSSAGVYKCYASNDKGSNSHETTVTVLIKPKMKLLVNNEEISIVNVEYNKNVQLTCRVISHSSPDIVWKNGRNEKLKQDRIVSRYNEYTSYLTVPQIKRSEKYYCEATNELATNSKGVSVQVKSPFQERSIRNKFTPVNYGADVSINCGITSRLPIKINWFRETGEKISNSDKYSISPDSTVLTIKQVRLDSRGKYICKASIVGDESMQETHDTTVDVVVEKPRIEKQPDVTVRRNQTALLKCHVTKGLPRPTITWMVMNENMNKYTALPEVGEELAVPFARFHHAGLYKCRAINDIGADEQIVKLFVEDSEVSIEGGGKYTYQSNVLLTCNVKAFPAPVITWRDDKGKVLPSLAEQKKDTYNHISKINIQNLIHKSAYYCHAQVGVNENSDRVDLDVISPFKVDEDTSKASVTVEFENPAELKCNIKSKFSMEIVWYHISGTNRKILNNSAEYKISSDETQMTVNKVKQENQGKYVCEARMRNDPTTTYRIETNIEIKQVAPIMGKADKVRVNENNSLDIKCNIMKAYPKPKVIWMFRSIESDRFQPLHEQGEILKIEAASLSSAGVYKCYASNDKGSNSHETTVTVLIKPKMQLLVNNEEISIVNVEYNKNVQLTCHVISHSSPAIVWKNERNEKLKQDRIISRYNEYTSYLTVPQIKRSEKYYCEATNELATNSKGVSVQVKSPFQERSIRNKFTPVNYGADVSINCGITSRLPIKINWFREKGEKISNSDKYSISPDSTVLTIKQVRLDSRGKYICNASIVGDESMQETHDTTVDVVVEKPQIEKQPDVTVRRNQTALLKCHVTKGLPRPTITWMVMNEKMNKYTALPEVGEELTVPFAQFHHAGLYKCRAINDIGADEQIVKLFVEGPPQILSDEDKLYTALVGDVSLRIPCVTVGYPKPVITWTTGSKKYSARKFNIDTDDTFVIKNPQTEDSGNYACKATNKFGSVEKTFEGYVMKYIDLDQDKDTMGNITYVDVLEGATKLLDCASGSLKGRWYKEGYPTNLTGVLTIDKATRSQEGNYTCRLSDNTGSKSHTSIVVVGKPPKFEDPNDEKFENWTGNDELLSCAVSESMRPKIRTAKAEWMFNGKPSSLATGGFEQSLHPIVSWGQYTCTISNIHGSVTKHFNVHSTGCLMPVSSTVTRSPLVMDIAGTWPKLTVTHKYLYMPHNQAVLLSCHNQSKPNLFEKIPESSEIIATCDHEEKFLVGDSAYKLSDLQCSAEVVPVVQATGENCFDENTETLKVGYTVEQPKPHFLEVYSVCFDKSMKVPIYTKANIAQTYILRLKNASWKKYDKYYNEMNKEFCVDDSKCCVNKRQLVDQLDVVTGPAQLATFIEGLNTVSYWSGCENIGDTLNELDSKIRSNIISKPYSLLSGAFKYANNNGTMVPRYMWKMVKTPTASIVYVRVNDPHPTPEDILCKETRCPSWMPKGNFSYCCRRAEFQNLMPILDD